MSSEQFGERLGDSSLLQFCNLRYDLARDESKVNVVEDKQE